MRKRTTSQIGRPEPAKLRSLPRHPLVIVLDDIRSAYNVGSIFRTADALRVERVICCGYTPTPEHHSVAKTALGAETTVPWDRGDDVLLTLQRLKNEQYTIAALEQTDASVSLATIRRDQFPLALILGNEVTGVLQAVLDRCDLSIELPQYGAKASLNVAVAFGVAGYGLIDVIRGEG